MSNKDEKQYGLILPKKQQISAPKAGNVFGDDNASDEEDGTDWVKKALKAEGEKHKIKKQTKLNMQKALEENPTIYQYDEVYDDMERVKAKTKITKAVEKKPKYIENLLKAAERRKKEQEHRIERMVQKEREAEGEMFADKESFVTSAYRAKLEEFKKMKEEDERMDRLESIGDVTRQQDLSGFYRHFYEQTVDKRIDLDKNDQNDNNSNTNQIDTDEKDDKEKAITFTRTIKDKTEDLNFSKTKKFRQYRKRALNTDESDSEMDVKSKAESVDTKVALSQDEDNCKADLCEPNKKQLLEIIDTIQSTSSVISAIEQQNESSIEKNEQEEKIENSEKDPEKTKSTNSQKNEKAAIAEEKNKPAKKRDKSLIWKKRTVGPVLEAALQRYYTRKAARASGL